MSEPIHVLIVDDDPDYVHILKRYLQRDPYLKIEHAATLQEAMHRLSRTGIDVVLLDLWLPGTSGLETMEKFDQQALDYPVIVLTSLNDKEVGAQAVRMGAQDFFVKGNIDDALFKQAIRYAIGRHRIVRELRLTNRRMQEDLEIAAMVQRSLLPSKAPDIPGAAFAWRFEPCEKLAGDLLNVIKLDRHRAGLYILDVAGHGVAAALKAVAVNHIVTGGNQPLWQGPDGDVRRTVIAPDQTIKRLNQIFPIDHATCQFFTILYGVLDMERRSFTYVSAGHPEIIYLPAEGRVEIIGVNGPIIGIRPDATFPQHTLAMHAGDRLYLCSDGVYETRNMDKEEYGLKRLAHLLEQSRNLNLSGSLNAVQHDLAKWRGAQPIRDDMSLLAVEIR